MELFIVLAFVSAVTLALGVAHAIPEPAAQRRLARLSEGAAIALPTPDPDGLLGHERDGWLLRLLRPLAGRAAQSEGEAPGRHRRRLSEAGYRSRSALTIYLGSRVLLALAFPLIALAAAPLWELPELKRVLLLCASAALGLVAPSFYIDRRAAARKLEIRNGLPDALDLMVVCVEAGLGINMSLQRIAREFARSQPILAGEFELMTLEARAGKSTTDALRALATRTGVDEVHSLVAMLVQTERFGTSLADSLRVHADGLRVQRMQRAEEEAGKAPLKMLFPTLLIFAATLLVTLGPGFLQLTAVFEK